MNAAPTPDPRPKAGRPHGFLPTPGTPAYHAMLAAVAILVLGPLGGIAAAYMNFSLGFFVGGQVLAGILGSAVTYGYGAEGRHGANYMQTMAASVASLSGMAVLVQGMVWLGMERPESWKLMLYFGCIGMFGVGVGMAYTPLLVDRMRLTYPSGLAVANILRALTDKRLLHRSVFQLATGVGLGVAAGAGGSFVPAVAATHVSAATLGAGMVVASRIAVPGLVMGLVGLAATPWLRSIGWLGPQDSFRKIGFLIALAMILGAALVDIVLVGVQAAARFRERAAPDTAASWSRGDALRLGAWVAFWGVATVAVATSLLGQPLGFVVFALVLSLVFVMVNGISLGISDSNPISSAFVISVLLMSLLGLKSPIVGMMAASILLVSTSIACDMQQDRSTGWRLGSDRRIQFRYQVVGVTMGAVLCVVLADVFLAAYPVLQVNAFAHPELADDRWQSAMTYKFVGAIQDIGHLEPYKITALGIGLAIGTLTEVARKWLHRSPGWRRLTTGSRAGFTLGWVTDSVLLPSPYASSFGGFVEWPVTAWFAAGGSLTSAVQSVQGRITRGRPKEADVPEDMSTTSLVGGGLIAGEALFYLALGIAGLLALAG